MLARYHQPCMSNGENDTHLAVLTVLPPETTDEDEQRIQGVGTDHFTLLEGALNEDATVAPGDRVATTDDEQGPVTSLTRLTYDTLSQDAQDRLEPTIESIIQTNEQRFIDYYNDAQPLSLHRHQLDLLPRIGETRRETIIRNRDRRPFEDFDDLEDRVDQLGNPQSILTERVLTELKDDDVKYTLLVE
jgi:putative nucleotide binding protein